MSNEIQKPDNHVTLEKSVQNVKSWAAALKVADNAQYLAASEGLRRVKAIRGEIEAIHGPAIEAAHAAHKAAIAAKKTLTDPLDAAERSVKSAISGYLAEQERLRVAEETRLRKEAEAKAEAERKRLAEEKAKADAEAKRLADAAAEAAKNADPLKIAEAEIAQAEAEQAAQESQAQLAAVAAAPVYVAPAVPAVRGQSVSKTWKARVIDKDILIGAAATNPALRCYLEVNESLLNSFARNTQGKTAVPGVEFYEESRLNQRR